MHEPLPENVEQVVPYNVLEDLIPENLLEQLKEIKEVDFDEKRIATYQKALERAWFDEKITADEQFILDGLREVLDNEHDRKKREIYDYFQRGSELYETDQFFDAIMEWEKILELDPSNPIIMKAINNARRRIDSPSIEALGQETVYSYSNPLKDVQLTEETDLKKVKSKKSKKVVVKDEIKEVEPVVEEEERIEVENVVTPEVVEEVAVKKEKVDVDSTKWLEGQHEIQSQLLEIKKEEELERKKIVRLFKIGYKYYKNKKYLRALKIWRKIIALDPEHEKARKGIKLAKKKIVRARKLREKKKALEEARRIKESEMEIPEIVEGAVHEGEIIGEKIAASTSEKAITAEPEMEISELGDKGQAEDVLDAPVVDAKLAEEIVTEPATEHEPEPAAPPVDSEPVITEIVPEVIQEPEPPLEEEPEPEEPVTEPVLEPEPEPVIEELLPEPIHEPIFEPIQEPVHEPIHEPAPEPPPAPSPEDLEVEYYNRAANFAKIGKFKEAVELLDQITTVNPGNIEAWNDKGILLWSLGNNELALESYEKAVELDSGYTDAWVNKGVVLNRLNRQEDALEAYDRALSIDSNIEEAWTNRGVVLYKLRKMKDAAESFKKGIAINPDSEEAWVNLGNTFEKMERFSDAIKAFERVLNLNSSNQDAHAGIAACQKNLKYEILREWNI
jgi:tetratricopeptide (TPR) repeat protein